MRQRSFAKPIRLPPEAYSDPDRIFHIVMRAVPGRSPFTGTLGGAIWDALLRERERTAVVLLAASLMPDHLHVVASPRDGSIPRWVQGFKSLTTALSRENDAGPFLWQPRFFDRALRSDEFQSTIDYIARNPVAGGLVQEPRDWPWTWVGEGLDGATTPVGT